MRALVLAALLALGAGGGLASMGEADHARGEWCGCKAGPSGCSRPCAGCCGGDEAVCFSGMDPTAHGPCGAGR